MRRLGKWVCVGVLAAGMGAPAVATADADPKVVAEADQFFQNGKKEYAKKNYEGAYELYLKAWGKHKVYYIAANLGQVEMKLGRYKQAAEHYEYVLRQEVPPEVRASIEKELKVAKKQLTTVELNVDQPGCKVTIDGMDAGETPIGGVYLEPGSHKIEIEKKGFKKKTKFIEAVKGEERRVDVELEPGDPGGVGSGLGGAGGEGGGTAEAGAGGEAGNTASVSSDSLGAMPWILGVGAVALGAGAFFQFQAASKADDRDAAIAALPRDTDCRQGGGACDEIASLNDDATSARTLGWIGFGVGMAAGAGAYLYGRFAGDGAQRGEDGTRDAIGWTLYGVSAVSAVLAGVFLVDYFGKRGDEDDLRTGACGEQKRFDACAAVESARDDARGAAARSGGFAGLSLLLAGAGYYVFNLRGADSSGAPQVSAGYLPGGGAVSVGSSF